MVINALHHAQFAMDVLSDIVPNPAPADPTGGAKGVELVISYAKWIAIIGCALTAAVSGGMMAVGKLSNRPDTAEKGKGALLWALAGSVVTALAIPLVNTVFGAAS